jgi:hypothetical protein
MENLPNILFPNTLNLKSFFWMSNFPNIRFLRILMGRGSSLTSCVKFSLLTSQPSRPQIPRIIEFGSKRTQMSVFPGRTQYPWSINVWAGVLNQHFIGPIRIDGRRLTGQKYVEMLEGEISDRLEALNLDNEIYFQHDGCPAHNFGPATDFLREVFPGRVIGTHKELHGRHDPQIWILWTPLYGVIPRPLFITLYYSPMLTF